MKKFFIGFYIFATVLLWILIDYTTLMNQETIKISIGTLTILTFVFLVLIYGLKNVISLASFKEKLAWLFLKFFSVSAYAYLKQKYYEIKLNKIEKEATGEYRSLKERIVRVFIWK